MPTAILPAPAPAQPLFGLPGRATSIILSSLAVLAIGTPAVIVQLPFSSPGATAVIPPRMPVAPKTELPTVDPVKLATITPDDARTINAAIAFSTDPNPAARPFRLAGSDLESARAIDCLATAVLYEAGDDTVGQRAVAQVIINRVRHPAFPKTICGVVFQGSERRTGCQFTFTCDGALRTNRWSEAAWRRAREVAGLALGGAVYSKVGHATHYHTDWVVPYWSSSLDKVSAVGTHLFFRWTGWWGTPPAFRRRVAAGEPAIAQLARFSLAHATDLDASAPSLADLPAETYVPPTPLPGDPNSFLATIDRSADPDSFRKLAEASCGARTYCKYLAWSARFRTPSALPLEPFQVATMSFSYLRDRARGFDKALWSCGQFPRADRSQCMKVQTFVPVTRSADATLPLDPTVMIDPTAKASIDSKRPRVSGSFQPARPATVPAATPTPAPGGADVVRRFSTAIPAPLTPPRTSPGGAP